ncbi:hypothetical protein JJD41_07935 [Oxynema sp. CENA135]|uniref:hypothetical protein n=1 Tax=Oxynema sp. CENA135 TaxID=984206 RepID=UPI00190C0145|nr:hypothetical protein [Oxynema sp. CENA135]MBK4729793.1 hypothetical protein [Oxynema sp. CENA135]
MEQERPIYCFGGDSSLLDFCFDSQLIFSGGLIASIPVESNFSLARAGATVAVNDLIVAKDF